MSSTTITQSRPRRKILLINGPNLNLLGLREPQIYGSTTLAQVISTITKRGKTLDIEVIPFQSSHEGAILDFLHSHFLPSTSSKAQTKQKTAVIINPAALTHTSVAVRDALLATSFPFIEVHISNVHAREPFRAHSYFSDKAVGVIMGLGVYGYEAALEFWVRRWDAEDEAEADGEAKVDG